MHLKNLKTLHKDMIREGVTQQKFSYCIDRRIAFDVLVSVRSKELSLTMTARAKNIFMRFIISQKYYSIRIPIDEVYYQALAAALRKTGESFRPLMPKEFFSEFNSAIPVVASHDSVPSPSDIVKIRIDLPEPEKPYFLTWRRNDLQGHKVSEENLAKTREILGDEAATYSERENLSSCWTAQERNVDWKTCLPI